MGIWARLRGLFSSSGEERAATITTPEEMLAELRAGRVRSGGVVATPDTAMRQSAVWACLRIRADLVSTMPLDVYRRVAGVQVEVPKPPVLVTPGGEKVDVQEWLYSSQIDLDRSGNVFGLITERSGIVGSDGRGLPARIDLVPLSEVTVRARGSEIQKILVGGTSYDPWEVWHEKQFTVAGLPLGLSPVAYAAWSIEESLNAGQFSRDWFAGGAVPIATLRNSEQHLTGDEAREVKARFRASVETGDVFVTGSDWEYQPIQAVASQSAFIEARQYSTGDIARFFGCPSDLIDAAVSGQSVTYANITERNMQFLAMNLGPAITRRETALSRLLPGARFVKLNRDAMLAMHPEARARTIQTRIKARVLTPNEARALEDMPPLTEEQFMEFERLFGVPRPHAEDRTGVTQ